MNIQTASVLPLAPRPRTSARFPQGMRRAERGASLIEIMVVLVILLTGVFLVIRIFPVGFGTLRAHENRTNSVRLAEQLLGQVRTDAVNLPQGVLMGYYDTTKNPPLVVITDRDPDNLNTYCGPGIETCDANPYFSDVNQFRLIRGESIKIPLPTTTTDASGNAVTGSVYPLRFGPAYMDTTVGNPANAPDDMTQARFDSYLAVKGAPLTRIMGDSNNPNAVYTLRGPQTYVIDYGDDNSNAAIVFPNRRPTNPARAIPYRIFTITYTYEINGGIETVPDVQVKVLDADTPVWQPIVLNGTPVGDISPGSDTVTRSFARLTVSTAFSDDPYEYKLVSNNVSPTANANFGVLNFNPVGANYSERTSYGQRAFTAYVDYAVLDWHIIHEDRDVPSAFLPSGGLVPVKTTLSFIKKFGDIDTDNQTYNGLYGVDDPSKADIQIFNLDDPTGTPLVAGDYNNTSASPNADYYIDDDPRGGTYRTGTIYVNTARLRSGVKLRILYKAEGDWAVSLQKAYDTYTLARQPDGTPYQTVPLRGFSSFAIAGKGSNSQIRVPYTDLNKAFLVTIQYRNTNGDVKRLSPIQMVADGSDKDPNYSGPSSTTDERYAYIDVSKYLAASVNTNGEFADAQEWYPNGSIQGVSAKASVIYHDNNNTTNSWRIQDLDTFLTPAAAEDVK